MQERNFEWITKVPVGIMQVGTDLKVMFVNDEAKRLLSGFGLSQQGGEIPDILPDILYEELESAMRRGEVVGGRCHNVVIEAPVGRYVRFSVQRWDDTMILTLEDVTDFEWAKSEERAMREEIDRAFTFSLLGPSVAKKLACTPEYRDEAAGDGRIKIVGVIPDGGYRHAINILKLASDLDALGIFEFPGISRGVLTKAAIYHDLCKSQPILKVGDIVDPKEVFLAGKVHAELGADMGRGYYKLGDEECYVIRYHHHEENELPREFPSHLLPQLRLFKILDGVSAGMTRRDASVKVGFDSGWVYISERNRVPQYTGSYAFNLYSGEKVEISEHDPHLHYQTQRLRPEPHGNLSQRP